MSNKKTLPAKSKQIYDMQQFQYVNAFRINYERTLKDSYALQVRIIPFAGGSIIENKIVGKELAETTRLENIYTLSEAFKKASIENTKTAKQMNNVKGTSIIIDGNAVYLIKDNSPKEWIVEKAQEDINIIMRDLLITPRKYIS